MKYLVYIFIVTFSIIAVVRNQNYTKRIEIINGYVKEFSVDRGEDVVAYLQPKEELKRGILRVYNSKLKIVDSIICKSTVQKLSGDTEQFKNGLNYSNSIVYNTKKLVRGLYFIDKVVPFIVKESELENNITVVFPLANLHAESNFGGKSFFAYNSTGNTAATSLSLNRPIIFEQYMISLLNWIDSAYTNRNVNFVTDIDLENGSVIKQTKLLIIYGNASFWTYEARKNYDNYLNNGGNVLSIATSVMNNKFRYEREKKSIVYYKKPNLDPEKIALNKTGQWPEPIFNNSNLSSIGCSSEITNKTFELRKTFNGIKLIDLKSPLVKNIKSTFIPLTSDVYCGVKIKNPNFIDYPIADEKSGSFLSKKIIGYCYGMYKKRQLIGGIFLMKKGICSGEIIVIGNVGWLYSENFKSKDVQIITKNCIDFLHS